MTAIRIDHVTKSFGSTVALEDCDLSVSAGELFFLLGPSGCGKSTLLRLIAGLHRPTSGRILFNDRDVTDLDTEHRNAVMCFQSYALWPHMTVRQNVQFGLNVRKVDPAEATKRVDEALSLVKMIDYADRKPNQLSGGQQQRVALARALAVKPDCLLLDEPLSNLDAKLRHEMRGEIRRICKTAGFTTIYVTHDQKEALSVADRIAVMEAVQHGVDANGKPTYQGRLAQVGRPGVLYHRPNSAFVADFIGATNLLKGKIVSRNGNEVRVETQAGTIAATASAEKLPTDTIVNIRPEQIRVRRNGASSAANQLVGKVLETTFLGEASEHVLAVNSTQVKLVVAPPLFDVPDQLAVEFDTKDALALAR